VKRSIFCAVLVLLVFGAPARAGVYGDDLARCLVESTSQQDRIALVRWMFVAASQHPAVQPISNVTGEQLDDANKTIAELFMGLLLESCRTQTEKALKYEGASTIETAFSVLGQVAGQELFASPEVAAGMAGLEKHLDSEKLQALVDAPQSTE